VQPIIDEDGDVLFKVRVKGHRETVESCLPSQYWNNIYEKDKISPAALMNSMQYVKKDALRSIQSKGEKMLQVILFFMLIMVLFLGYSCN
jgi:hypothetical protein